MSSETTLKRAKSTSSIPATPRSHLARSESLPSQRAVMCSRTTSDVLMNSSSTSSFQVSEERLILALMTPPSDSSGVPRLTDEQLSFAKSFEKHHRCLPPEDDPIAGVLNPDFIKQLRPACCLQKKLFVDLAVESNLSSIFTQFGRRLNEMAINYGSRNFMAMISEYWLLHRHRHSASPRELNEFLTNIMLETDGDNVEWCFEECSVCSAPCRFVRKPPCCHKSICQICWRNYLQTTAKLSVSLHITGVYNLHCFSCSKLVPYNQALACTERDDLELIRPKLHGATSSTRCSNCLELAPPIVDGTLATEPKKQAALLKKLRRQKGGHPHTCSRCGYAFCRFCGASNHDRLTCQQLNETEAGLQTWVKQKNTYRPEFPNGRRCPKCSIAVSHGGGCSHMTCVCGCEFCYLCGRRFLQHISYFESIHSNSPMLPLISCPKLWKSKPKRILVHSIVGFGFVVGVVPAMIALSPIALSALLTLFAVEKCRKLLRYHGHI